MTNTSTGEIDDKNILKQTVECILKQGIFNVELSEISEFCGVQVCEINNYFGSKDKLILSAAKKIVEEYRERVYKLVADDQNREISGFEIVKNILEMRYDNFKHNYKSYFFMNEVTVYFSGKNKDICDDVQEEFMRITFVNPTKKLAELIKIGVEDGSIRKDIDMDATAKAIFDLFVMGMEKASTKISILKGEKKESFEKTTLGGISAFVEATLLYIEHREVQPANGVKIKK